MSSVPLRLLLSYFVFRIMYKHTASLMFTLPLCTHTDVHSGIGDTGLFATAFKLSGIFVVACTKIPYHTLEPYRICIWIITTCVASYIWSSCFWMFHFLCGSPHVVLLNKLAHFKKNINEFNIQNLPIFQPSMLLLFLLLLVGSLVRNLNLNFRALKVWFNKVLLDQACDFFGEVKSPIIYYLVNFVNILCFELICWNNIL